MILPRLSLLREMKNVIRKIMPDPVHEATCVCTTAYFNGHIWMCWSPLRASCIYMFQNH